MLHSNLKFVLGSQSPRRQELLKHIVNDFRTYVLDVDESFPVDMPVSQVAEYLANKKSTAIWNHLDEEVILLTADSIVVCGDTILNKPEDELHATKMLEMISGRRHEVHTAFCLKTKDKTYSERVIAEVEFGPLSSESISHYIRTFRPYDKAGAYGIQEWIGFIGVKEIKGSFANIMGLPVYNIYNALMAEFGFLEHKI
ncbi:MAG: septum formation protein Maf [Saprospiraceae bacterium]|nr:septum formation protein Maf [Saprospiraceae bacterium]